MNRNSGAVWWIIGILIVIALAIFAAYYFTPATSITSQVPTSTSPISTSTAASSQTTAVHVDLFINGFAQAIPSVATSSPTGEAVVATPDGVVTFSPPVEGETLGDVFAAFGQQLSPTCVAGYCASATQSLNIYVNGQLWQGDPTQIPLENDEEIAVVYGTSSQIPNPIPSSYDFPTGE